MLAGGFVVAFHNYCQLDMEQAGGCSDWRSTDRREPASSTMRLELLKSGKDGEESSKILQLVYYSWCILHHNSCTIGTTAAAAGGEGVRRVRDDGSECSEAVTGTANAFET
jgi:hypothetical protein